MAWDGKEFEKPLVLLNYYHLNEAQEQNAYKVEEDLEELAEGTPSSEEFVNRLARDGKIKEACDYLAYAVNPRAGLWWAYLCVKEFREDMKQAEKDKEAASEEEDATKKRFEMEKEQFEKTVADGKKSTEAFQGKLDAWGQEVVDGKIKDPENPLKDYLKQFQDENSLEEAEGAIKQIDEMKSNLPPDIVQAAEAKAARIEQKFKDEHGGKSIRDHMKESLMQAAFPPEQEIPNKMDVEEAKLKDKIETIKEEIAEKLSIFPLKIPGLPKPPSKKKIGAAFEAALRWILAPTETNSKKSLEAGNEITDKPEGMLAMSSFWSGNNLTPESENSQIIKSPPGLASRGIATTIFLCAINQDIKHKDYDQRYEDYFNIGIDVAQGINTWGEPFDDLDPLEHVDREQVVPKAETPVQQDRNWEGKSGFGRVKDKPKDDLKF